MVVYNDIIIFMLLLTCLIKVYLWIDVYNGLKHASEK